MRISILVGLILVSHSIAPNIEVPIGIGIALVAAIIGATIGDFKDYTGG